MTVHVLHAGDGYTYLTRQVASGDQPRQRGKSLADYYTAQRNPPGRWLGEGLSQLGVDGEVTEEQMRSLFGRGMHPDAEQLLPERIALYVAAGDTPERATAAAERDMRLGRRFPKLESPDPAWHQLLRSAYQARAAEQGVPASTHLCEQDRHGVRLEVGRKTFIDAHGRGPNNESELRVWIAVQGRRPRQPVAGYDLVFTPVKSVSVLWALSDPSTSSVVMAAHHAAVARALAYLERHAALTRTGSGGVAQVDTHGLVIAAFDHYDSRTGDPDLHTHCAVSTKVRGQDGRWRSLDARVLFALAVSASETYNTAIEDELTNRLGVRFVERTATGAEPPRASTSAGLRLVREIEGLDPALLTHFASRRTAIEADYDTRLTRYRQRWGHEPPRASAMKLAQEATLATRSAKRAARSLQTMRADWIDQACRTLRVDAGAVRAQVRSALSRPDRSVNSPLSDNDAVRAVLTAVQDHRATWTVWHLRAETERVLRGQTATIAEDRTAHVDRVVRAALAASVALTPHANETVQPAALTRRDGESIYRVHGTDRYTSTAVLDAEDQLVAAARTPATPIIDRALVDDVLRSSGDLDQRQALLVRAFTASPRLLVAGIGPAGAGKTRAMSAVVQAATSCGVRVIGLAPSARAAQVLSDELTIATETIHKLLYDLDHHPARVDVRRGDIVLVDEAGMAGTLRLARLTALASERGALIRLVGDPNQLDAVESGGALRLIDTDVGAVHLDVVHRFKDPAEGTATLQLRDGDPKALDFYQAAHRIHEGSADDVGEAAYRAWRTAAEAGRTTILLAVSGQQVRDLSARARLDRIADGDVDPTRESPLHDGTRAGAGDVVITRRNDRRLSLNRGNDWVKNGDLWRVTAVHDDGSLDVQNARHRGTTRLPPSYVAADVELGYAFTIHRAQGLTVDDAHLLVDASMTRQSLYTGATRGRTANHLYVATSGTPAPEDDGPPPPERFVHEVLRDVLRRDGSDPSATQARRDELEAAASLSRLVPEYLHVLTIRAQRNPEVRQAVLAVFAQRADEILTAPSWPALARTLATIADAGHDPAIALATAAGQRELRSADDIAGVLGWRLTSHPTLAPQRRFDLLTGVPAPPAGDDELSTWLGQRAARIRTRIDSATIAAQREPAAWLAALGPRPQLDDAAWTSTLRAVVAYRDTTSTREETTPLGTRPLHAGQQQTAWDVTTKTISELQTAARRVGTATPRAEARLDRPRLR